MSASSIQGPVGAVVNMSAALAAVGIRLMALGSALLSWFFFMFSISPYLFLALTISLLMIPYVEYQADIIEDIEYGMRCEIEPFYRTWPRQLLILLRILYDPTVCWYDIIVWYPYGVTQNVIIPLAIEGGLLDAMTAFGNFLAVFLYDFLINYYATFDWLTQPFDYQATSDAWVAFWPLWQNTICYLCEDLCVFIKLQPLLLWHPVLMPTPMINPLALLGSNQIGDPQFVCALFETFNGLLGLFQPLFQIIVSIFVGQTVPRPDWTRAFNHLCTASGCLVRSIENAAQFFVDEFLPFPFNFVDFFCFADVLLCLFFQLINNLLTILVNIDQVVFYEIPGGNDFYLRVVKRDLVAWLNLMAPLNYVSPNPYDMINGEPYAFLWPSTEQAVNAPDGQRIANPMFGKMSLAECVSLFWERLICDPTNNSTACFDPGAQDILGPFDPGCLPYQAIVTIADIIAGVAELSYHLFDDREFFVFVDRQLTTTIWAADIVDLVKCILDAFAIIPVMGPCLSRFFTGIVAVVLESLDFIIRFIICLVFLAYYIINNIPCFITEKGRAQVFIRDILNEFANVDDANSVVNCLCFMLNYGIQIPPIPCSSCIPGGWIQPSGAKRRRNAPVMPIELDPAHSVMNDATPIPGFDYYERGDARWIKHTRGKQAGHSERITSLLQELNVTQSHKRHFYDSFRNGTHYFEEYVHADDMNAYFKAKRARFEHKLEQYLEPWRNAQTRARADYYYKIQQQRQKQSFNVAHHEHWMKPWFSVAQDVHASGAWDHDKHNAQSYRGKAAREVITPTEPPISGCTPTPPCFDTCDMFRSFIEFLNELIILATDMIFSLLQDWDIGFPYYVTGDVSICSLLCPTVDQNAPDCSVACPGINISFEEDLRNAIVAFADLFRSFCNLLNLVVPVEIPGLVTERPDICCAVVRLGDLVACALLVFIKSVKALALESDAGFPYFTQGLFLMDVDFLFDITFDVVVCLCNLVRAVFPVQNVADLDLCCIVQNGAMAILELLQWAFQIVISLGTIQTSGNSYFVDPDCGWTSSGCTPNVNSIGFVAQGDIVMDSIFGAEGGACSNSFSTSGGCGPLHGKDMGVGGLITCVCQLVTTIFPVRPDPGQPTSNTNCPIVDMCCVLRRAGFAANSIMKFAIRLLATTWQRWSLGAFPLPEAFIAFWFCDENTAPPDSPCAQVNPIIENITSLVSQCLCEIFSLVDAFFAQTFETFSCFCGQFDGIFCGIAGLVEIILKQFIELFRRLNDPTYWQPRRTVTNINISQTGNTYVATQLSETWSFRFFKPIFMEACKFAASLACFIQVLVPKCNQTRAFVPQGIVIWIGEAIIRFFAFIEGFVLILAGRSCSGSSNLKNQFGWDTQCLTGALVSLLSFPVDALIADASVTCNNSPCACYNNALGIEYVASDANYAQVTNNRCVLKGFLDNIPDSFASYQQCESTLIAGALPLCRQRCLSQSKYGDRCVDIDLPRCVNRIGTAVKLDGVLMAIARYFRCMLAIIFPFFASFNPVDILILIISIFWQLSRAIINFIAAFIVFFFILFTVAQSGIGGCRCHNASLAIQRNGAFCYNCHAPQSCTNIITTSIPIVYADCTRDASPGDDILVPQAGEYKANYCCLKSTYSSVAGSERCDEIERSESPLVVCSGLQLIGAFLNLISTFVNIFTAVSRVVAPNPSSIPTNRRRRHDSDPAAFERQRAKGPVYFERGEADMTPEQREDYERYRTHARARYHMLRSRYNQTRTEDPFRYVFHRWLQGTRDPLVRSRHHFKKRAKATMTRAAHMSAGLYEHNVTAHEGAGDIPEVVMDALFGFDTDDCMDDPIACICRNMDVPEVCTWDPVHNEPRSTIPLVDNNDNDNVEQRQHGQQHKPLSTRDVLDAMVKVFDNQTVCDAIIRDMYQMRWIDIPFAIRSQYMDCIERRIQGERIRDMYEGFPPNMFYSPKDGIPQLIMNMHSDWNYMYTVDNKQQEEQAKEYERKHVHGTRFENMNQQVRDRYHAIIAQNVDKSTSPAEQNALHFLARLDQFEYKLTTGYYAHHLHKAYERMQNGESPKPVGMLRRVEVLAQHTLSSSNLMFNGMARMTELPGLMWNVGVQTSLQLHEMHARGPLTVLSEGWQRYKNALARDNADRPPPSPEHVTKRRRVRRAMENSPFYQWMFGNETTRARYNVGNGGKTPFHTTLLQPFARFRTHLNAIWTHQQQLSSPNGTLDHVTGKRVRQDNIFNLWGARGQWEAIKRAVYKRWEARPLTRKQRENRAKGWRVLNKVRYMWDPSSVSREEYERFIFDCNCEVVDGSLALLVDIVNYCATSFMPNTPMLKRIVHDQLFRENVFGRVWSKRISQVANYSMETGALSRFVQRIEPMVRDTNYTFRFNTRYNRENSHKVRYQMQAWPIEASETEFYYMRPRIVTPLRPRPLHRDLSRIDRQQWRRNQNMRGLNQPAESFNLLQWLLCLIDEIFNLDLAGELDQFFMDLTAWFNNPSTDPADYPNVGFKYWATFWLRCDFPYNLDCSIGIGLEAALGQTLKWFAIVFILGSFVIPSIMMPLMTFGLFMAFVIVVPCIAWHYSPRCWLMTPSVVQGPISVPLWPFPIAPPALPFCALDDINNVLDKWISTCYSFLIPEYMVRGPVCPACPNRIDFIPCTEIGVSDGLSNVIYLGQWIVGDEFCNWLEYVSQMTFFQLWFPGFDNYTEATCQRFRDATPTQMKQQRWCFWATIPTILLPLSIGVVFGTLVGYLVPAVANLIVSLLYLIAASPLIIVVPGGEAQYFYTPGDDGAGDPQPTAPPIEALYPEYYQRRSPVRRRRRYRY